MRSYVYPLLVWLVIVSISISILFFVVPESAQGALAAPIGFVGGIVAMLAAMAVGRKLDA